MSQSAEKENSLLTQYEWMIRPCVMYQDEYSECRGIRGRFHQYFIHGEYIDCTQWKKDFDNCVKWTDKNDIKAAEMVIKSEQTRRYERLKAHYSNDVWERRTEPPPDWNKPLPDYIAKNYENTYLDHKAKQMRGEESSSDSFEEKTFCVIM